MERILAFRAVALSDDVEDRLWGIQTTVLLLRRGSGPSKDAFSSMNAVCGANHMWMLPVYRFYVFCRDSYLFLG